jgi:predicted transcriptional regulator
VQVASLDILWKLLNAKRWALLKAIAGKGPVSFRQAADLVGRDVKGVHTDITALLNAGVVQRTPEGILFPYDTVRIEYELRTSL